MKRFSLLLLCAIGLSISVTAQYSRIITLAGTGGVGSYGGDGYAASGASLNGPHNVAVDKTGNVYIVDYYNARIRKVKPNGIIVTFAGTGAFVSNGDGTVATNASMNCKGVAADSKGNVYISDNSHCNIRKVGATSMASTYAGSGACGYMGDGGAALSAKMSAPYGLFVDKHNSLYIAEAGNHIIRKIDSTGRITTVAGQGVPGNIGDNGPATAARLDSPYAMAVDRYGNIYIADYMNNKIRKVTDSNGYILTIAGTGVAGYTGDSGLATAARLNRPAGIAVDSVGNVFFSDANNNVIRRIDTAGIITTVVGNGTPGFGGDLGNPKGANLFHPMGIAMDTFGSMYIADANNQRVRKVYNTTVGIEDVTNTSSVTVFPVPANDFMHIEGLEVNDVVVLLDITGNVIETTAADNTAFSAQLAMHSLPSGMYMVRILNSKGATKEIIKVSKY